MDNAEIIRKLKRQLLVERVVAGALAMTVALILLVGRLGGSESMIVVDGKALVCVPTQHDAESILQGIKSKAGGNPAEIDFKQEVAVVRAPRGAQPVSRFRAMRIVERSICPVITRWAIVADGEPVVALPDKETAGRTLNLAKLKFGKMVPNLMEEPQFKERVTVCRAAVSPAIYRDSAEAAVTFLFDSRPTARKDAVYTVQKGDVAGSIAEKYGLRLNELVSLNPGRDLNRLQIGDELRIKRTVTEKAKLTVVVRDQSERTERIPAPVRRISSARLYAGQTAELSSGRDGLRKVKIASVYENGRKVGEEIVDEVVIKEPVPREIAVGIKPKPTW